MLLVERAKAMAMAVAPKGRVRPPALRCTFSFSDSTPLFLIHFNRLECEAQMNIFIVLYVITAMLILPQ